MQQLGGLVASIFHIGKALRSGGLAREEKTDALRLFQ
jgi:hypothetical protein